jgi:protein TonB
MPEFPGGEAARVNFMKENIKFPANWPSDSIKGKVFTTFIIDENGNIKCPRILRGINSTLDSIAIAVIKKMPKWSPAKARGVSVSSAFNLPIIFGTKSKTKK